MTTNHATATAIPTLDRLGLGISAKRIVDLRSREATPATLLRTTEPGSTRRTVDLRHCTITRSSDQPHGDEEASMPDLSYAGADPEYRVRVRVRRRS